MRATLTILGANDKQYQATFDVLWNSATQWREELQLPGYSRVRVGGDHKYWVQRNVPFEIGTVQRIDELIDISAKLRLRAEERIGKSRQKKVGGVTRDCVQVTPSGSSRRMLCFDSMAGAMVLEDRSQPGVHPIVQASQTTRAEYGDFRRVADAPRIRNNAAQ